MYKCASCGHTSEEAGEHCDAPMQKSEMYKCDSCGHTSGEAGEHCGAPMEKMCACGSGDYAADCCEVPQDQE
ncbi:hypothetical protein ACFL3C_05165 [Patescibacteria group bacterium]